MGEFLDFSFYDTDLIQITVGNILLLLAIIIATRILLQLFKRAVHKSLRARDNFDQEREHIVQRTGKAIILITAIFSAIASIGLWQLIQAILDFELVKVDKINITVGKIFIFILILMATGVIARLLRVILRKNFSQKTWIDEGKEYTVFKLTKYGLFTVAVIIGLTSIGIDMKLILAGAGALLVGIGFGLQYLFYDLISGLIILFEGPIKVGDVIEVGGIVARVQQIDIRTSKVMTRNGKYIIIPNSKLVGEQVTNWSHASVLTRFEVKTRVAFGTDTLLAKDLIYNAALHHPDVSKNREIIVRFEEFGESGLHFSLFFWAKKTWVVETLQSEIRFEIDRQFRKNKIRIPFPQRDIHVIPREGDSSPGPMGFGREGE